MLINLVTEAIFDGDIEQLKKLLKTNEDLNLNICDSEGNTPLQAAVTADNLEALDLLLAQPNVDVNITDEDNRTCIFMGILYNRSINIIKRLIEMGCDVNMCNTEHNSTPLHLTVISFHNTDIAKLLIKSGANINTTDYCGFTPLHEAVLNDNLQMVQLLLFYGADTTIRCDNLCNPFMAALLQCNHAIASELIDYQYDFNDTCCAGSILSISLRTKSPLTEEIIDRGADVNLVKTGGITALEHTLYNDTAGLFKKIWPLIDKKLLLDHCNKPFLHKYIFYCRFSSKEWTECLYEILSSDIAFELVEYCVVSAEIENDFSYLFECVINGFVRKNVEKNDRIAIIYILLTFDMPTFERDLLDIYNYFGYNEELEAFLFTNLRTSSTPDKINKNTLLVTFIVNFDVEVDSVVIEFLKRDIPHKDMPTFLESFLRILNFVTPTKAIKDEYYNKHLQISSMPQSYTANLAKDRHNAIVNKFNNMQEIPSLLELSRNAARTFVYNNTTKKSSCYYQTLLKKLEIPKRLKSIIKFKQCLYKV